MPSCTRFTANRRRPSTQRWLGLWRRMGVATGERPTLASTLKTHSSPVAHCCYETLLQGAQCCTSIERHILSSSCLGQPRPAASYTSELEAVRASKPSKPMLSPVELLWRTRNAGRQTDRRTHMYIVANFFFVGGGKFEKLVAIVPSKHRQPQSKGRADYPKKPPRFRTAMEKADVVVCFSLEF